jgi:hypothetical protein
MLLLTVLTMTMKTKTAKRQVAKKMQAMMSELQQIDADVLFKGPKLSWHSRLSGGIDVRVDNSDIGD